MIEQFIGQIVMFAGEVRAGTNRLCRRDKIEAEPGHYCVAVKPQLSARIDKESEFEQFIDETVGEDLKQALPIDTAAEAEQVHGKALPWSDKSQVLIDGRGQPCSRRFEKVAGPFQVLVEPVVSQIDEDFAKR